MPENSLEPEIQDVVKGLLVHSPDNRMSLDEVAEKVEQLIQFLCERGNYYILYTTNLSQANFILNDI
jgi:predicted oxidoreductase